MLPSIDAGCSMPEMPSLPLSTELFYPLDPAQTLSLFYFFFLRPMIWENYYNLIFLVCLSLLLYRELFEGIDCISFVFYVSHAQHIVDTKYLLISR